MNRFLLVTLSFFLTIAVIAQNTANTNLFPNDTVRLGNLKIIKINGEEKKDWITIFRNLDYESVKFNYTKRKREVDPKDLETTWLGFDFGLTGYSDYTKYVGSTYTSPAVGQPLNARKMQPRNSSTNVNIWVVKQKVNAYQRKLYFKYGFGFEMFNYYYANSIDFRNNEKGYISLSGNTYDKDKLFVDYLTIPLELSRSFKVKNLQTVSISGGVELGYLLSTHNKQINSALGKKKYYGDFNFNHNKIAGVFQLDIGDVKFYGSMALTNMLDKATTTQSLYPNTFGIRFSKF